MTVSLMARSLRGLALLSALACAAGPASAQSNRDLAARLDAIQLQLTQMQSQQPADGSTEVRILKLESLIEQLTGQVEEANFRVNQLTKQVKTLEDDLQLRVATLEQGASAGAVPGATSGGAAAPLPPRASAAPAATAPAAAAPPRRLAGDEPLSQPMTPPRVTRPQTAPEPGTAAAEGVNADGGFVIRTDAAGKPLPPDPSTLSGPVAEAAPPAPAPAPEAAPRPGAVAAGQLAMAPPVAEVKLPDGTPKVQYDFAFDLLRRNDFARAEVALREFLKRHPKDPLAGNAQYWLGETYYVRGDYQQAAVEFMAGYQNYPKANKGPDNLLKLAMSMSNLGQSQGACTALNRLVKDYPKAPDEVSKPAAAERAKLKCK